MRTVVVATATPLTCFSISGALSAQSVWTHKRELSRRCISSTRFNVSCRRAISVARKGLFAIAAGVVLGTTAQAAVLSEDWYRLEVGSIHTGMKAYRAEFTTDRGWLLSIFEWTATDSSPRVSTATYSFQQTSFKPISVYIFTQCCGGGGVSSVGRADRNTLRMSMKVYGRGEELLPNSGPLDQTIPQAAVFAPALVLAAVSAPGGLQVGARIERQVLNVDGVNVIQKFEKWAVMSADYKSFRGENVGRFFVLDREGGLEEHFVFADDGALLAKRNLQKQTLVYLVGSRTESVSGLKDAGAAVPSMFAENAISSHAKQGVKDFLGTFAPPTAQQVSRLKGF